MINVYQNIKEPTNITTTLVEGGTLEADTTYYYVMAAYDDIRISGMVNHSDISLEGSFTTSSTHKSVHFNWINSIGHTSDTRYIILISKVSGDYTDPNTSFSVALDAPSLEILLPISDGTTGFLVDNVYTEIQHIVHSVQFRNRLNYDIPKHLGTIVVEFISGDNNLEDIYNEIVSQGYGDYVYYDGNNFALKGYFYVPETMEAGNSTFYNKNFIFIKGGILVDYVPSTQTELYSLRFGLFNETTQNGTGRYTCNINIQNSRTCIFSRSINTLYISGSRVVLDKVPYGSWVSEVPELRTNSSYSGGGNSVISGKISGLQDNIYYGLFRNYTEELKDNVVFISNNFSSVDHHRLKILLTAAMPYSNDIPFYNCTWADNTLIKKYARVSSFYDYDTQFFNCKFPHRVNNIPNVIYFSPTTLGEPVTASYIFNHSLKIKTIKENGDILDNCEIKVTDKNGDLVELIEYFTDETDKKITGNTFNGISYTDINGLFDYYIKSTKKYLNPEYTDTSGTITEPTDDILTDTYYPFNIEISKSGYETNSFIIENFTDETELIISLKEQNKIRTDIEGNLYNAIKPETGSDAKIIKL